MKCASGRAGGEEFDDFFFFFFFFFLNNQNKKKLRKAGGESIPYEGATLFSRGEFVLFEKSIGKPLNLKNTC